MEKTSTIDGVKVTVVDFSNDDPSILEAFEEKLADMARFMGASEIHYKDDKDESYLLTKPDGRTLRLTTGHDVYPSSGYLKIKIE